MLGGASFQVDEIAMLLFDTRIQTSKFDRKVKTKARTQKEESSEGEHESIEQEENTIRDKKISTQSDRISTHIHGD